MRSEAGADLEESWVGDFDSEKRGTDQFWLPIVVEDDGAEINGALHARLAGELPKRSMCRFR